MRQSDQLQFGEDSGLIALRLAWNRTLNALSGCINSPLYESVIKPVVPLSFDGHSVLLSVPTDFARYWVEQKYGVIIKDILGKHLSTEVELRVKVLETETDTVQIGAPIPGEPAPAVTVSTKSRKNEPPFILNDSFRFDSFVVGASNRMAFAASSAVAQSPGEQYNPLFIYGGPTLGKTHLLHAIAHYITKYHPSVGLMYINAEKFTCDYIDSVTNRKTAQFRKKYRNIDVWLVDDIQFLAGKERTKEEFFHTFNALHEAGRQIVLTSDKPPRDLQIDERLWSRFEAGLVVDIAVPDLETRMAIIRSKADKQDLQIPNEVVLYIARLIRSNIRALEGALMQLHAYVDFMKEPISADLATDILSRYFEKPRENTITQEVVTEVVARHYQITEQDLVSARREAQVVLARQIAMYLIRENTKNSLPAIGRAFGGRDHSTVLYAVNKIAKLVTEDSRIADDVARLTRELRQDPSES